MFLIVCFFSAIAIVCLGWCLYVFVKEGVPDITRAIENHYRERGEVDFHSMVSVVYHEIPEPERDKQIKRYVGWSDRRWDKFKSEYQKQTVLADLLPDIEMLRSLK
jgi:hypothetical protein